MFAQSRNFYEHNMIKVRIIRSSQKKSKAVLLLWIFYVFVLSCVCYVFVRVCLYVLCGHLLGKGWPLGSRLWCLLWVCHFPIGILGQVWYLIVSIPDLCTLTFFESSARIDGYDYQNKDTPKKHYHYEKISYFFSAVYNQNPCDSILLFLPSWTTSWIFYNAETQHHASQIRRMQLLLKTIRKRVVNCDSDFKWDFALKWRPSWTPS